MDITEVARRSGVPAATLRFYEEKGSITSIGRGLRRTSDPAFLSGWRYCAGPFRRHYLAHVSRDKTGSSQLIIGSRRAEALGDVRGKAELSPTLFLRGRCSPFRRTVRTRPQTPRLAGPFAPAYGAHAQAEWPRSIHNLITGLLHAAL